MVDVFERTIGVPYPYERYSQIAVADFLFGGMENTTATTQTDRVLHDERAHLDYSADFLASHELAHQWFGDLVTCRDWSQAWLNEGFATYFESVWLEAHKGWDEYLYDVFTIVQRYLEEDGERYRRPIVCNLYRDPSELFDRHLYEKGGAVLHMLRGELGWERMQRALRRYVADNAGRNVETIDLIRAIEAETGRNTRQFFAQWVERSGHPELDVSYRWDGERKTALITVAQQQIVDDDHRAYAFDIEVGFVAEAPASLHTTSGPGRCRARRACGCASTAHRRCSRSRWTASRRWCAPTRPRGCSRRGRRRWGPTCTRRCCAATRRRPRASAPRKRSPKTIAGPRAKRSPARSRTTRSSASASRSRPRSATRTRRRRVRRCSPTPRIPHPKVRRAVAKALGAWRDAGVASALLAMRGDAVLLRDRRSAARARQDARRPRVRRSRRGAPANRRGTKRSRPAPCAAWARSPTRARSPLLHDALAPARHQALRRAAVHAVADLGSLVDSVRTAAAEAVSGALDDADFLVRTSACAAAERLADARLLPALDRIAQGERDGRLRRHAAEAAIRVREAQSKPAELARLRDDVEQLAGGVARVARTARRPGPARHEMNRRLRRLAAALVLAAVSACGRTRARAAAAHAPAGPTPLGAAPSAPAWSSARPRGAAIAIARRARRVGARDQRDRRRRRQRAHAVRAPRAHADDAGVHVQSARRRRGAADAGPGLSVFDDAGVRRRSRRRGDSRQRLSRRDGRSAADARRSARRRRRGGARGRARDQRRDRRGRERVQRRRAEQRLGAGRSAVRLRGGDQRALARPGHRGVPPGARQRRSARAHSRLAAVEHGARHGRRDHVVRDAARRSSATPRATISRSAGASRPGPSSRSGVP